MKAVFIIEQFHISGRGTIAYIKHQENGLPRGTKVLDQYGKLWIVEKRLLIHHAVNFQRFFENETLEEMLFSFSSVEKRNDSIEKIIKDEEDGVFQYLINAD
jgi:hypothetical protein